MDTFRCLIAGLSFSAAPVSCEGKGSQDSLLSQHSKSSCSHSFHFTCLASVLTACPATGYFESPSEPPGGVQGPLVTADRLGASSCDEV